MRSESVIDPESVVRALNQQAVAVKLRGAALIDLDRVSNGLANLDGLLLSVLSLRVRVRCFKKLLNREVSPLLHITDDMVEH